MMTLLDFSKKQAENRKGIAYYTFSYKVYRLNKFRHIANQGCVRIYYVSCRNISQTAKWVGTSEVFVD